ncbi:MAG: glycosyltransferase [Candidatus Lokiarchaeota archaeon]|nr:glycosyltransferase [Candidatus Lokiarchaeota archaeon]
MSANDMNDMSGQTVRIFELVKFLSRYYQIDFSSFQKPPVYLNPFISKWYHIGRRLELNDFGTIYGIFHFLKLVILMKKTVNESDAKIFYTDSFYLLFLTLFMKKPTVFELHGIITNELVSKGKLPALRIITSLFDFLFNWLYSLPDLVITVTSNLKIEYFRRTKKSTCVVIPNGVDIDRFVPVTESNKVKIKKKHKICLDCIPLIYVSGMRPWHGLSDLIIELEPLLSEYNNTKLYLVGDGPELNKAKKKAYELNLDKGKVSFLGSIHHSFIQEVMAISLFGLYFYGYDPFVIKHFENIGHNPIKILEYMAVGVPVIVPNITGLRALVQKSCGGWIYDPKPGNLLIIIKDILQNKEEIHQRGKDGRLYIKENYGWNQIASAISKEIKKLIS